MGGRARWPAVGCAAAVIGLAGGTGAAAKPELRTFSNATPIVVADRASLETEPGLGLPYPSSLEVSGVTLPVIEVRVGLWYLCHPDFSELDVLLVNPRGQALTVLSDVEWVNFCEFTIILDDVKENPAPPTDINPSYSSGRRFSCESRFRGPLAGKSGYVFPSTIHAITDCPGADVFPAGAPQPSVASLRELAGADPNGTWSLYVVDDTPGNAGRMEGGWKLDLVLADMEPPETTITLGPRKRTVKRSARLWFGGSEPSTFHCKLDRRPWTTCGSPRLYKRLRPGRHVFRVVARDEALNVDPTPAVYQWRVVRPRARASNGA